MNTEFDLLETDLELNNVMFDLYFDEMKWIIPIRKNYDMLSEEKQHDLKSFLSYIVGTENSEKLFNISFEELSMDTIKKSKSYLYLTMRKIERYIASVTKGLNNKHEELKDLLNKPVKEEIDETKEVKAPDYNTFKHMHKSVGMLLSIVDQLNEGTKSLKEMSDLVSKVSNKKEADIKKILENYQNIAKTLNNKIVNSIGLNLVIKNDIFSNGFRIIHKQPDWEASLSKKSLKSLNYDYNEFINLCKNSYLENTVLSKLNKLHGNVIKLEQVFFRSSEKLEKLYKEDQDEIFIKAIHGLLSIFYLTEIMDHKNHMWLNKLWKYEIIILKQIVEKKK